MPKLIYWYADDCVQINERIDHFRSWKGFEDVPPNGSIGVIQWVDWQGDAWVDFTGLGGDYTTWVILNPDWADVWPTPRVPVPA